MKHWLMAILVMLTAFQAPILAMGAKQLATKASTWTAVGGTTMNESLAGSSGNQVGLMVAEGSSVCKTVCRVVVYTVCRLLGGTEQDCEYIAETVCETVCEMIGG
jgi:hypothetical protein